MMSSDRSAVPRVFSAPTVSANGELPGDTIPPTTGFPSSVLPKLPAAATTRMPSSIARCTAWHSGSSLYDSSTGLPSERLMIRMLYSRWWAIGPVDRFDHVAGRARPVVADRAEADDVRARRHAAFTGGAAPR